MPMLWRPLLSSSLFTIFKHISEASRRIAIKFYLKHHWGGGKDALGFGAGQFRTLVSMAADSSHRVIMGKTGSSSFLECF